MQQDLVSIIMPTYNASKFIAGSIDSVLGQTYRNIELVITDDASTDAETLAILKEYSHKDSRVKVYYLNENKGPGYARNHSIKEAKGRYIAFCDSDDRWMPYKLEKQIVFMKAKKCALCGSSYIVCDDDDKETGICIAPHCISFGMMKRDNKIGCLTVVYDTQLLGRKFYFPLLRKRQDWGLLLLILKQCKMAYAIKEPLALYRNRQNSVSSNKLSLIKYNIAVYQKILGFSRLKAIAYFLFLFIPSYYSKKVKNRLAYCAYKK